MTRRTFLKSLGFTTAAVAFGCAQAKIKKRPNIILIMADDMGYSDIGWYDNLPGGLVYTNLL